MCRLAHQDLARSRQRLQSGGEVGGVADGRVVHLEIVADGADDDRSGVDADAGRQLESAPSVKTVVEVAERLLDLPGGAHGTIGRVLVRHRRAEERHHPVTGELVDDAFEAIDLVKRQLQVLIEQIAIFLGIEAFGDRRGADEITEQHGHQFSLAGDRSLNVTDLVGEILRNVSREAIEAIFNGRRGRRSRRRRGRAERSATLWAKAKLGLDRRPAIRTRLRRARAARVAELCSGNELATAALAAHGTQFPSVRVESRARLEHTLWREQQCQCRGKITRLDRSGCAKKTPANTPGTRRRGVHPRLPKPARRAPWTPRRGWGCPGIVRAP